MCILQKTLHIFVSFLFSGAHPPSCQVMESLLIALVDLSSLLLPRLAADPGTHLGRLLDLVGEVTEGMQEQVCVSWGWPWQCKGGFSLFLQQVRVRLGRALTSDAGGGSSLFLQQVCVRLGSVLAGSAGEDSHSSSSRCV